MAVRLSGPKFYVDDDNGFPLAGGKVYFYEAGSFEVLKDTFTGAQTGIANTNPVILNAAGYAGIFLDGTYNIQVYDSNDVLVWTEEDINSNSTEEWVYCASANYISTTSFSMAGNLTSQYSSRRRIRVNNSGAFSYSTVKSSSFSSGVTTVVVFDSIVAANIVSACVSIVSSESFERSSFDSILEVIDANLYKGAYVTTKSYSGDWVNNSEQVAGGSNYQIVTPDEYTQLTGKDTPDENFDFSLNNGLIAIEVNKIPRTVQDLKKLKLRSGIILNTSCYYAPEVPFANVGSATYQIMTLSEWQSYSGLTTPDGYGDHEIANGNVAVLMSDTEVLSSQYGTRGDGVSDETAALQASIVGAKNKNLRISRGRHRITSALVADTTTGFLANDFIHITGEGKGSNDAQISANESCIIVDGNFTAFKFVDQAGIKGSMRRLTILSENNTYNGGGSVTFNNPGSAGLTITDCLQFEIEDVLLMRLGTGVIVQNEAYWSEGTKFINSYVLQCKTGIIFRRNNGHAGGDSFSHTYMSGMQIQIPKDASTGFWQKGIVIHGTPANNPAQIYNSYLQVNLWTNDNGADPAIIGQYLDLYQAGRIFGSTLIFAFERDGEINIAPLSQIRKCSTFFSTLDEADVVINDLNTDIGNKFRTNIQGNVVYNANGFSTANWDNRGIQTSQVQGLGVDGGGAAGFHYIKGLTINSPLLQCDAGGGNGFFFQKLDSVTKEKDAVTVAKIDHVGLMYPGYGDGTTPVQNSSAYVKQLNVTHTSLTAGSIGINNTTNWNIDARPIQVGREAATTGVMSVQMIHARGTGSRPSSPSVGQMYFDTTLGKPIWHNGANWVDATGTAV